MLVYILSAVIVLAGVFFLLITPVAGAVFIVLGIVLIVWQSRVMKQKKEKARPRVRKSYDIAGLAYHEEVLDEIRTESDDYAMSAKKVKEADREDERIYKYDFPTFAKLEKDPTNEHDKNAIKVLVGGHVIGFIPAKDAVEVGGILDQKKIESISALIEGGPYKQYDSDSEEFETGEEHYSGIVTVVYVE